MLVLRPDSLTLASLLPQGPIVRISPHELHINDPEFYDKLYRNEGRWEKYKFPFAFQGDSKSVAQTLSHDVHRLRRAALNPFFSKQKIAVMESAIMDQVEKLSRRIEGFAASGQVLPLGFAYSALTMDIITEYAMEKTYGNLDYADFNQDMVDCIRGFGKMWRLGKHMNWLPRLMALVPTSVTLKLDPKLGQWKAFQEVGKASFRLSVHLLVCFPTSSTFLVKDCNGAGSPIKDICRNDEGNRARA